MLMASKKMPFRYVDDNMTITHFSNMAPPVTAEALLMDLTRARFCGL